MASNRTVPLPASTLTPTPTPKPPITSSSSTTLIVPDSSDLGEFVTFIIGPSKKKFLVHKTFACNYSPVLKAAFTGTFIEGQTQTYTMEDTTEGVFTLLTQWFYTQKLDGDLGGASVAGDKLARLWVLAERLLIPRLQNLAIDRLEEKLIECKVIYTSALQFVWDSTAHDSPLRRLFIHQCVWHLNRDSYRSAIDQFPKQMLAEICFLFEERAKPNAKFSRNMADFHVKED